MISVRKMEILDDEEETPMMVDMECWEDELSPEQKATYKQLEKEHKIVKNELDKIVGMDSCKMVFNGLQFKIIEVDGPISKLPSGSRERRKPPTPPPTYRRDSRYRDGTLKKRVRFVVALKGSHFSEYKGGIRKAGFHAKRTLAFVQKCLISEIE